MNTNEQNQQKKDDAAKGEQSPKAEDNTETGETSHTSEGHPGAAGKGNPTSTNEPILRSATTDSSRVPKKSVDDMPTGGNIR